MAAAPGGRVGLRRPRSATAALQAPGRGPATPARLGTAGAGVARPAGRCRGAAAHLRVPRAARRLPPERADGETRRPGPARPRRRSAASLLLPPPHARARRRRRHPARARARPRPARPRSWGSAAAANQRARAREGLAPPPLLPPRTSTPPSTAPPHISGGGGGEGALSAAPPRRAPARPGLPRSPHPPTRHRGLGAAARTSIVGGGRGHRAGRDGAAPQCLPPPLPPPPRRAGRGACERRLSGRQQNGVSQALRPGGAPGRRRPPCTARYSSRRRCPRAVSGAGSAGRRPPPLGSGYPLPLSAAPRGPARRPRRAPPPPSRAPAGRAVGLRGAAVQSRAEPCEPCRASPAGERRRVPAAWLSSPGSAAPGQPRSRPPSRRRAARTGPAPARSAGTGRHRRPPQPARGGRRLRRYLRCGPGSPPPAARVRAPRRAAAAPARLGRHGAGGSRGSAGMWHRGGAARAARGAGPGCRPPGCRRGARLGAARADPLPPPAAALCFSPHPGPAVREPPAVLAPRSPRRPEPRSSRSAHPGRERPLPGPRCPAGAAFPPLKRRPGAAAGWRFSEALRTCLLPARAPWQPR
ncbi:serine/arginine repetitive matrix protein 1-like [Sylvia atricapilla]|uniref:serine/arginine repetitive matrix protein 1-like n=1 Tax=Sylvia atricapilla TaxID=48155 RepID=UPI003394F827